MPDISRGAMLRATGVVGAIFPGAFPGASPVSADALSVSYLFLSSEESAFVEAAVARLIPADGQWGSAIEAGVPSFIDKQLAGAWGAGERHYRGGPWQAGAASQGYQLPFTPAELFRTALDAINKQTIGALTYWAFDAIKNESLKARGPLVHA
jgi:gluconate 2-dehydrogenase gamma chain